MKLVWKLIIKDKAQFSNIHMDVLYKGQCLIPSFEAFFFFKLDKGKFDWQIPEEGFLKQTLNSLKLKEVYKLQNGI